MRRLLVKLVALETALVGWLGYWIFLLYSSNPLVSGGLATQLSRFPQVSFTTVDITVIALIGCLSIVLAFKFDRGLKPGIRLERALQMLESLMKRNLVLEAQITEMKMASMQRTQTDSQTANEPPLGSWERAFRTPIEAGPTLGSPAPRHRSALADAKQGHTGAASFQKVARDLDDEPLSSTNKPLPESAPALDKETPTQWSKDLPIRSEYNSAPQRNTKKPSAVAQPSSRRQPYIPVPASKTVLPSTSSATVSPVSRTRSSTRAGTANTQINALGTTENASSLLPSAYQPSEPQSIPSQEEETTRSTIPRDYQHDDEQASKDKESKISKPTSRTLVSTKERFPWEDQ